MKVYITQCLCPQRHAIFALAFEAESDHEAIDVHTPGMVQRMEELFTKGAVNRHCGICGSTDLFFETGRTSFTTMAEATPSLLHSQAENIVTRMKLDLRGESHDTRRNN